MKNGRASQVFGRLGWRKAAIAACSLLCGLGLSASVMAEEPSAEHGAGAANPSTHKAAAQATLSASERRHLGFILLGTSGVLGAGMIGVFLLIRLRRRRRRGYDDPSSADFRGAQLVGVTSLVQDSGRRVQAKADKSAPGGETTVEAHASSRVDFAPEQSSSQSMCPKCSRLFPSTLVVCPYDSATLLRVPERSRAKPARRTEQSLERLVCTGCDRRYEPGISFCYHDGLPLMQDTRERARQAPTFKACEDCGWEGQTDDALCPHDGGELIEIDASDSTKIAPTIPMMVCPKCRNFGPPGKAFCPDDGELLTPLVNVRVTEFPAHGFGPRRKVCETCGTEHSGHAQYCSCDGSKLVALN